MYKVSELLEIKHHKNMNNVYDIEFRIEVNNDELEYPHYGPEIHM